MRRWKRYFQAYQPSYSLLAVLVFMMVLFLLLQQSPALFRVLLIQTVIYYPAILASHLLFMAGFFHFAIGGLVVLGIQSMTLLYLVMHVSLPASYPLVIVLLNGIMIAFHRFYIKYRLPFVIVCSALLLITKGLNAFLYTYLSNFRFVSATALNQAFSNTLLYLIVFFLCGIMLYCFLNFTYPGRELSVLQKQEIGSDLYKKRALSVTLICMFSIVSVLILTSSLLLMKRTGVPNIYDGTDLSYMILTASALSHRRLNSRNIIPRALLSSFVIVSMNLLVQQMAVNGMFVYTVYGAFILLSYIEFRKNKKCSHLFKKSSHFGEL